LIIALCFWAAFLCRIGTSNCSSYKEEEEEEADKETNDANGAEIRCRPGKKFTKLDDQLALTLLTFHTPIIAFSK
jgi:hypothetical protein